MAGLALSGIKAGSNGNAEADKSQPKPARVENEVVKNVEDKADNLVVGNVGKHFPKPKPAKIKLQLRLLLTNQPFKGVPT